MFLCQRQMTKTPGKIIEIQLKFGMWKHLVLFYVLCTLHDVWVVSWNVTCKIGFHVQGVPIPNILHRAVWHFVWILQYVYLISSASSASCKQIEWRNHVLEFFSNHYHTAHCSLWQAWLQAFVSSYGLASTRQHFIYLMWRHMPAQSATRIVTTERNQFTGIGSFGCLGMTLPVHGTSDYTGIRTSHVFRPGIEPGSTAWKSRELTTQPATHIPKIIIESQFVNGSQHTLNISCHDDDDDEEEEEEEEEEDSHQGTHLTCSALCWVFSKTKFNTLTCRYHHCNYYNNKR